MSTTTKERPILMSVPMVRAVLEGRKTQTRHIIKPQPAGDERAWPMGGTWQRVGADGVGREIACPYGVPDDWLYVKECFARVYEKRPGVWATCAINQHDGATTVYAATHPDGEHPPRWRPSIHMPRWASRLTLEIVSARVERVQEISEADCAAEGMTQALCESVLSAAAKMEPQESYHVRGDDEDFTEGHQCYKCAQRTKKKYKKKGAMIVAENYPESDGPAYCDDCRAPLLISLTAYGVERELLLEGFGDTPPPEESAHFAASGLDAAIAGMIAGGIGDLREEHKGRLNKIGFATLWDSINGPGAWARNDWVWVIEFRRVGA